jgi:hypothetical protein
LRHLRKNNTSIAVTKKLLEQVALAGGLKLNWPACEGDAREAIQEMIQQRILVCKGEWGFGCLCSIGEEPILGETAEERFAKLPELPELPRWMIFTGNLLIGVDALLFFIFYCTYLPQSWIGPVTGTGALIGALLSYAGLRLSDQRALTALHWTRGKWLSVFLVGALLAALTWIGYVNPCIVRAPPGAQILVDGKMAATVPTIISDNPFDWLANAEQRLALRWDNHEILIRKKWWMTGEWHDASVQSIELQWTHPRHLFEKWNAEAQLAPLLRITSDSVLPPNRSGPAPQADQPSLTDAWLAAVAGWDAGFQSLLSGGPDESLKPIALKVEVRTRTDGTGTLAFGLFNWKGEILRPFLPITINNVSDTSEIGSARKKVFTQLEQELQIKSLDFKDPQLVLAAAAEIRYVTEMLPHDRSIAASVLSTTAALPKIAKSQESRIASTEKSTQSSIWNSAAVAREAMRLRHPDKAAQIATEISKVGEAAAGAGRIQTAEAAKSSLSDIVPPPAEGPPDAKVVQELDASQARIASAIASAAPQSQPVKARVYLHIAGESQRSSAAEIEKALQSAGYVVPGIQNVLGRAYIPDTAEVRYFVYPDAKSTAEQILTVLQKKGCNDGRSSFVKPSAHDAAISTDITSHFEVWFGKNSL